jgi:hypothetical protein
VPYLGRHFLIASSCWISRPSSLSAHDAVLTSACTPLRSFSAFFTFLMYSLKAPYSLKPASATWRAPVAMLKASIYTEEMKDEKVGCINGEGHFVMTWSFMKAKEYNADGLHSAAPPSGVRDARVGEVATPGPTLHMLCDLSGLSCTLARAEET